MKTYFIKKLSIKLISIIFIVLITTLVVQTFLTQATLKKDLVNAFALNTYRASEIIKNATLYGMKKNNKNDVHEIVKNIGRDEGLESVRIFDKKGKIVFSNINSEINKIVNDQSSTCAPCHFQNEPIKVLNTEDRIQFEEGDNGHRNLVMINPIQNSKDCYTSDCHAHNDSAIILGILEVKVSLDKIDGIVDANIKNILFQSVIETIIISLLMGFLITYFVNKPLQKITEGIKQIGAGKLNYKINLKANNELGNVAKHFDEMSEKLELANNEIKKWNENLNIKIEEKTEELKTIYEQVIQIEKLASLGKLSATVAHELNNPLEGILTYSKLITKKLKKENNSNHNSVLNFLELISEETARCGKIVKDLLLFSHSSDDALSKCELIGVINKSLQMINHHLELNKIILSKHFKNDKVYIKANAQKIQQALMSLFINAVESMNEGGKLCVLLEEEKNYAILRIIDEGCGINDEVLPHIFEPFYTTKDKISGTGLGLSVVYGIIKSHNGKVEVEDSTPEGTTFKITIPLIKLDEKKDE